MAPQLTAVAEASENSDHTYAFGQIEYFQNGSFEKINVLSERKSV